jgi:acyl-coenzyme A thioesterase PaaI-like protein
MKPTKLLRLRRLINFYPPYIGAGIRVKRINPEFTRIEVEMKLRWYNKNLFGTHFGGSLYSMCDPFFLFIVIQNLGAGVIAWDKSAKIRFRRPGKGTVRAIFEIDPEKLDQMREEVMATGKQSYFFQTEVLDEKGIVVAEVEKEIYIRVKDFRE